MSDDLSKKRTLRCTDEEWQQIVDAAEERGLSASAFLVERALAPERGAPKQETQKQGVAKQGGGASVSSDPAIQQIADDLRKLTAGLDAIRSGMRFIAFAVSDWYIGNGRRDLRNQRLQAAKEKRAE